MSNKCDWAKGAGRDDDGEGDVVRCPFCGKETMEEWCCDEDWIPYFWDTATDKEYGHVCPDCALEHLDYDEIGQDGWLLKPGHALPSGCVPSGTAVPPDRRFLMPPGDN